MDYRNGFPFEFSSLIETKRLVTAQMLSRMWSFFVHAKRFSTVGVKMVIPSSVSTMGSVNILLPMPTELD